MKFLWKVIVFITFALTPLVGHAQDVINCNQPLAKEYVKARHAVCAEPRIVIDIDYIGGGLNNNFTYPRDLNEQSGIKYDTDGVAINGKLQLTNIVSVEGRYERLVLRNPIGYSQSSPNNVYERPYSDFINNTANYWEISGTFKLPKTHGHSLIAGIARATYTETANTYAMHHSNIGFVAGGEGKQKFGPVTFDYSGRVYPHMTRKDYETSDTAIYPMNMGDSTSGYQLRGTATWMLGEHFGIRGGYQFRRLNTTEPDPTWPINENQDNKGFTVGGRFLF